MDAIRFFSDTSIGKHEIDSFMTRKKKGYNLESHTQSLLYQLDKDES